MSLHSMTSENALTIKIKDFSQNCKFSQTLVSFRAFNSDWKLNMNCISCNGLETNEKLICFCLHRYDEAKDLKVTVDVNFIAKSLNLSFTASELMPNIMFSYNSGYGFILSIEKLIDQPHIYLPHNILVIDCNLLLKSVDKAYVKENDVNNDLLKLYDNEKFCDLKITTADRTFNVHKTIICARSPVFASMFNHDTIEARDGVIKIQDLDSDTVSALIKYMYSSNLDVANSDQARDLYTAADKYQVLALKNLCSDWLKKSFHESDVCDTYMLANMHQDEDLKAAAENYLFMHSNTILKSSEWSEFMKSHSGLAAEIMHKIWRSWKSLWE